MDEAYCFPARQTANWDDRERHRVSASSYRKSRGDQLRCSYDLCFDRVFFKRGGGRIGPHFSHYTRVPDAAYCDFYHEDSAYRPERASLDIVCLSVEEHIRRLGGRLDRSRIDEGKVYVTGLPVPFVIVNLTLDNIGEWVERETDGEYRILFVVTVEDLRWINENKYKREMLGRIVSRRPVQTTAPSRTGTSQSRGLVTRPMSLTEIEEHLANAKPILVDWQTLFDIELPISPFWMQDELVTPFLELQEAVEESVLSPPGGKTARLIAKRLLVDGAGVHRAIFKQEDPERARQPLRVGPVFPLRRHLIDGDELAAAAADAELERLLARHEPLRQTFDELPGEIDKPVVTGTVGGREAGSKLFWIEWSRLFGEDRIPLDDGPIWIRERCRPSLELLGETLAKQGLPPRTRKALGLVAKELLIEAAGIHQTVFEQNESEAREPLRAGPVFPISEELVTPAEVLEITRSGELAGLLRKDPRLARGFDRLVKAAEALANAERRSLDRAQRQVVSMRGELDSARETAQRVEEERDALDEKLSKSIEVEIRRRLDLKAAKGEIRRLESARDALKRDLGTATSRAASLDTNLRRAVEKVAKLDDSLAAHKAAIRKLEKGVVDSGKVVKALKLRLDGQAGTFRKRLRRWRIAFAVAFAIALALVGMALVGRRGASRPLPAVEHELAANLEPAADVEPAPPPAATVEPRSTEPPPAPARLPPPPEPPQASGEPPEVEESSPSEATPPETPATEPPDGESGAGPGGAPSEAQDDSENLAFQPPPAEAEPPSEMGQAESPPALDIAAALLRQALEQIEALRNDGVVRGKRDNLRRLVTRAERALEAGERGAAISKLEEVVVRVDRCAGGGGNQTSRRDKERDWITDCDAQRVIHALLERARRLLAAAG